MIKVQFKLWICGQIKNQKRKSWEFQGVFLRKKRAIAACKDRTYFIGPVGLNEEAPQNTKTWPGAYYPHAAS